MSKKIAIDFSEVVVRHGVVGGYAVLNWQSVAVAAVVNILLHIFILQK